MGLAKETIWFTTKTLSFAVLVLLILFTVVTMTGSALPDNEGSGQLNSESPAVHVLDADHHHLGDGVKPELAPADAEGIFNTKIFVLDRIDGDTAGITLTTKSVVPTDTAGIGHFHDQVYVNGNNVGKLNDYIEAKEQDNLPRSVTIYFSTKLLYSGENNISISSGCNADCSDYDDFEFYDLRLEISPESKYQYSEIVSPPLRKIWSSSIGGYRNTPLPVVSQSGELLFYTSSNPKLSKEMINAIDARNGKLVWSHETGGSWLHDHVVYAEGLVFASDPENIYAFGDDVLEWKFNLKPYMGEYIPPSEVHPVVYNNTVYTTINSAGKVLAIDVKTGELKWIYSFGPGQELPDIEYWISYDSTIPAVSKGIVVFIAKLEYSEKSLEAPNKLVVEYHIENGEKIGIEPETESPNAPTPDKMTFTRVFALNASNGEEIWNYSMNSVSGFNGKTPFIYNDLVYFGLEDKIVARTLGTGKPIWSADVSWPHIYAVSEGKIFASAGSDVVVLDAYNGSSVWRSQGSSGPLSVYGGLVYVGISGNENLLVLDGNTGEQVWRGGKTFGQEVSQPVLSNGRLYMSASDGRLYAFEHGEPGIQDTLASLVGYLPLFAIAAMLVLLIVFMRKIENKSLAFGSWLLALALYTFKKQSVDFALKAFAISFVTSYLIFFIGYFGGFFIDVWFPLLFYLLILLVISAISRVAFKEQPLYNFTLKAFLVSFGTFFIIFSAMFITNSLQHDATSSSSIYIESSAENITIYVPVLLDENKTVLKMYENPEITGNVTTAVIDTEYGKALMISGSGLGDYLFNWNEVPGKDTDRFVKWLEGIGDVRPGEKLDINKTDDGRVITVSGRRTSIYKLNETGVLKFYRVGDIGTSGSSEVYLFNWNEVPGKDTARFVEWLESKEHVQPGEKLDISKTDDGRKITVSGRGTWTFWLNDEGELEYHGVTKNVMSERFGEGLIFTKEENGQLNIYAGNNEINMNEKHEKLKEDTQISAEFLKGFTISMSNYTSPEPFFQQRDREFRKISVWVYSDSEVEKVSFRFNLDPENRIDRRDLSIGTVVGGVHLRKGWQVVNLSVGIGHSD